MEKDKESVEVVKSVCGVTEERAVELLEAGGSLQRAIDIHLTSSDVNHDNSRSPLHKNEKRKFTDTQKSARQKQSKLSSFFTSSVSNNAKPIVDEKDLKPTDVSRHAPYDAGTAASEQKRAPAPISGVLKHNKNGVPTKDSLLATDEPRLQYISLAEALSDMASTTKRHAKIASLKKVLVQIIEAVGAVGQDRLNNNRVKDAEMLHKALQLILPNGIKLQVSGASVSKAIQTVTGASQGRIREAYRKTGDLGDAAERFVSNQTLLIQPKPLTIPGVHELLCRISSQEGKGSQAQRQELMVNLLRSCRRNEMRFLVRTLLGNMRVGANLRTVVVGLAHAVVEVSGETLNKTPEEEKIIKEEASKAIQDTCNICPRFDKIALALLCGGITLMKETCVLELSYPISPMLANPAHSLDEVAKLMSIDGESGKLEAIAEYKYDGVRCQAHFDGTNVYLYSRNMLETTEQFPDVVAALMDARTQNVQSFVLDSEIVGVEPLGKDKQKFRLLPFQDLSTRNGARPDKTSNPVSIKLFAFDLIYINGQSVIDVPLWRRTSISMQSFDENLISGFVEKAVKDGAEGLMVKLTGRTNSSVHGNSDLACKYEAGNRSHTWLKVKRDYVSGFHETIDVVPIGAWHGTGRKAQKGFLSPVLLAVYDEEEEVFQSICRCMSFSDAMYDAMREFYFSGIPYPPGVGTDNLQATPTTEVIDDEEMLNSEEEAKREEAVVDDDGGIDRVNCYAKKPSSIIDTNENPSIWFKPLEVFEVSFADLSHSRQHRAATGLVNSDPSRGVALRFPRFLRRRPDKTIEQATSPMEVARMFERQSKQSRKIA